MDEPAAHVTVYGAEWCPPCHTAKAYLKSSKVEYKYINVAQDPDQGRMIAEKTGWTAIPIINIGQEYILGFDRQKIDAALQENNLI